MIPATNILSAGNFKTPNVLVVTDPPSEKSWENGKVMTPACVRIFQNAAIENDFGINDFCFVCPCPPIPEEAATDSRVNKFLDFHRDDFLSVFNPLVEKVKLVIYLGKWAGRQVRGRTVKITEARGQIQEYDSIPVPVLPLLSPSGVLRRPENAEIFETDFRLAGVLRDHDYSLEDYSVSRLQGNYRWCVDLTKEFDIYNPPKAICLDCETVGLKWYAEQRVLCAQLSWKEGESVCVPLDLDYWNNDDLRGETSDFFPKMTSARRLLLLRQLRIIFGNSKVFVVGHNLKFDLHCMRGLGINVANFLHDTQQLAFVVDDNMQRKSLDECTRRWLPDMAGYADTFNANTDKERMDLVLHDDMCRYSGGDTDATRQLCFTLVKLAKEDRGNYRCYIKIQMPALRTFFEMERHGIKMDKDALTQLGNVARHQEVELRDSLLSRIPGKLKKRHLDNPSHSKDTPSYILSFSRAAFTIDVLFSPKSEGGMGLVPRVFTESTRRLPPEERVPSCSSKDHLPYFDYLPFVQDLMDYMKLSKLRSTYIGAPEHYIYASIPLLKNGKSYSRKAQDILDSVRCQYSFLTPIDEQPEFMRYEIKGLNGGRDIGIDPDGRPWWRELIEPTGFWKYLSEDSCIHSSYRVDRTVTGRTASQDPNGQNIPARGSTERMQALVAAYRKCFVAKPGCKLINADLSQNELRMVAWMAQEPTMLEVYRTGGDIHKTTACKVMGIDEEEFEALSSEERKMARFRAKAVNFGFIYGMWWKGFMVYAKTDYGLDLTEAESEKVREDFFELYSGLEGWHKSMKDFCSSRGYVRSLHGALRRLPSVYSDDEGIQKGAQRQAINSPIQRMASDLALIGMSRFVDKCPLDLMWPVGFIHDSVIIEAREEHAEEAASAIMHFLETPPLLEWFGIESPIPLLSDVSIGENLHDMEEREDIEAVVPEWA